jgi:hypothetical protein
LPSRPVGPLAYNRPADPAAPLRKQEFYVSNKNPSFLEIKMANPFRSVFGAEVDRFLVGKLVFGMLAILSLLASATSFIRANMASTGKIETTDSVSTLVQAGVWSAVVAVVWIAAFYWVERARRRAAQ